MALLTTWSNSVNMITDVALLRRYDVEGVTQVKSGVAVVDWKITRYATKRYRYVGMTEAAARACAAAKIQKYTRTRLFGGRYNASSGVYDFFTTSTCQAEVAAAHEDGPSWRCDIAVNETDVTYYVGQAPSSDAAMEALFGITNDYDEPTT